MGATAPKQAHSLGNRIANGLVVAFFVAGAIGTVGTAIDSKLRAMSEADKRVIAATVHADSIELLQKGPSSLNNCTVTINGRFTYQAGTIQLFAFLPLREFALEDGERFDTRRYKVGSVQLDCDGISRSIKPQR
jgi:hypothetical protein